MRETNSENSKSSLPYNEVRLRRLQVMKKTLEEKMEMLRANKPKSDSSAQPASS